MTANIIERTHARGDDNRCCGGGWRAMPKTRQQILVENAVKESAKPQKEDEWILFLAVCDSLHDFLFDKSRSDVADNPVFKQMVETIVRTFNDRFVALTTISNIEDYITHTINARIPVRAYADGNLIKLSNSQAVTAFETAVTADNNINTANFTLTSVDKTDKSDKMFLLQQQIHRVIRTFMCQNDANLIPVFMIDSSSLSSEYYCYNTKCGNSPNDNQNSLSQLLIGNSSLFDSGSRVSNKSKQQSPMKCKCHMFKETDYVGSAFTKQKTKTKKNVLSGDVGVFMDRTIGLYGYNRIHNIREEQQDNGERIYKWNLKINDNVVDFSVARTKANMFSVKMLSETLNEIADKLENSDPNAIKDAVKALLIKLSKIYFLPIGDNATVIQSPRRQAIGELTAERKHEITKYLLDLKRSGDWLQVLSCYVGNKDDKLNKKYRFIFVSNDESAIAFARYMNVPAIFTKFFSSNSSRKDMWLYRPVSTDPKPYIGETNPAPAPAAPPVAPAPPAAGPKKKAAAKKKTPVLPPPPPVSPVAPAASASASSAAGGAGVTPMRATPARGMRPLSAAVPPASVSSARRAMPSRTPVRPSTASAAPAAPRPMTRAETRRMAFAAAPSSSPRTPVVAAAPAEAEADAGRGLDTPVPRAFIADLVKAGVLTAPYWQPIVRNGYTLTLFEYVVLRTANDLLFADAEASGASSSSGRASSGQPSV